MDRKSDIFKEEVQSRDTRKKRLNIEIDMNPMVDLAFLLLTFFMLTTTFNTPQAMEIVMPAKADERDVVKEQPVKESRTLSIILGANDRIHWFRGITDPDVQTTDYSTDGVRSILLEKNEEINDIVVLIKPTENSNYKNLVDILDEMSVTDIKRYAIVDVLETDRALIADL